MHVVVADHISKIAASIYAAHLLRLAVKYPDDIPIAIREIAMNQSILEAKTLWHLTIKAE